MSPIDFDPRASSVGRVALPRRTLPSGRAAIYFSQFLPFSNRANARELVENRLFYLSAQRFDVFSCFSSHMSRKPAILAESAGRLADRFADRPQLVVKELGAGYGESMAVLLQIIASRYPVLYQRLTVYASDGYQPVLDVMRRSPELTRYFAGGKLIAAHEDLMGELPCKRKADYVRISYTLTDLPEDLIKKEKGQFFVAQVKGYLIGEEDFVTEAGTRVPAETVAELLEEERIQEIIDLGLDIRAVQPRVGYDVEYRPIDYAAYPNGWQVRAILEEITAGIENTNFRMGLNAARAIEKIAAAHLEERAGSTIEVFDIWTAEIMPDMPAPKTGLDFTSVNSVNLPFVRAHCKLKGLPLATNFEDWKTYIDQVEPYIYLSHFAKWLKGSPEDVFAFFSRPVSAETAGRIAAFLDRTKHIADMVLHEEKESHPFVALLRSEGFSEAEIEKLFSSRKFPEPVKSQSRGFYGLYQVVTLRRI